MNNQEIAKKVIDALGGRENVNSVAHCATRLRVMVKDEGKINKEVIENLEKVQGAFFNSGQYQKMSIRDRCRVISMPWGLFFMIC